MRNRNLTQLTLALGAWVVLSSLFLWRGGANAVNGWITGAVVIVSALLSIRRPNFRYVSAAAGVWLVAALFAWPEYSSPAVWSNAMVGAAIALVAVVGPAETDMITS
jgi:hypothetical protein